MHNLIMVIEIEVESLDTAMEIIESKDEFWENVKEEYEGFELEYDLSIGNDRYAVIVSIYGEEE